MLEYSVYVHRHKLTGKRYVGVTSQSPERRWQRGAGYAGTLFGDAIRQDGWDAFTHEIICSGLSKEQAFEIERSLIAEFHRNDPRYGYNISKGGYADDCLPRLSGANHWHHAKVKMKDPETMEVIREFDTQSEAAKALGINRKGITKACLGQCQTYKGFVWEYAERDYEKPVMYTRGNYMHIKQCKAIELHDVDGRIYVFKSIKSASSYTGVGRSNISRYLLGLRQDQTGRRWCYA